LCHGAWLSKDRFGFTSPIDGDADVPSTGSEEDSEAGPEPPASMWDNGPLLNSEADGIRELLNPDRPIMYGREVSHGSGPISGVSVLPW